MGVLDRIREFLHSRFLRVLIIGGIGVLAQTVVFETVGVYVRLVSLSTAVIIGAETGVLANFYLNNRFAFHDRQQEASLLARLVRFHIVVSGSVLIQWLSVFITEHQTADLLFIHAAYAAGIILGFAWNYTFYLLFVWRRPEPPKS